MRCATSVGRCRAGWPAAARVHAVRVAVARRGAMTPAERYRADVSAGGITADPVQLVAVAKLDDLYHRLLAEPGRARPWWRQWLRSAEAQPERGLYLWGGVGRGKTYLMDLFYECLPAGTKTRMHFHRCMQRVHRELRALSGTASPLAAVAEGMAQETRVLCFDEFFVSDIGDAMILGELMQQLFRRGVTLVATSNIHPSGLYENGLQRRRFVPAIDLLLKHTEVHHLDGAADYRLRALRQAEIYHHPLDEGAEQSLAASFASLIPEAARPDEILEIEGRPIRCRFCAEDVVWFDFAQICDGPRSQNDYIELSRIFHAVVISNVPQFTGQMENQARRFISLVDEFYDHSVKLILSAAAPITQLYQGTLLQFEFQRTVSRLLEMQSLEYLARTHHAA